MHTACGDAPCMDAWLRWQEVQCVLVPNHSITMAPDFNRQLHRVTPRSDTLQHTHVEIGLQ
jgi:hypothetical protein